MGHQEEYIKDLKEEFNELNDEINNTNMNDPEDTWDVEENITESFEQMLNESQEDIEIGGATYQPSEVLKAVDPVNYKVSRNDYTNALLAEAQEAFDNEEFDHPQIAELFPDLQTKIDRRDEVKTELESHNVVFEGYKIDEHADNPKVANFNTKKKNKM